MNDQIETRLPPLHVICRPARQSDTADVLELTRTFWDGHDYVPEAWAGWLADPQGLLAVAEYQGRGVASQINDYLLAHWLQTGNGALRLATSSERVQVHHMCQRNCFTKVAEFTWYPAPSLDEWGQNALSQGPISAPSQEAAFPADPTNSITTMEGSNASNLMIPDRIF